jgi:hypothetical protein
MHAIQALVAQSAIYGAAGDTRVQQLLTGSLTALWLRNEFDATVCG